MDTQLIGTGEAARYLGLSRPGVVRRVAEGRLKPVGRLGKRRTIVFRREDIEALARETGVMSS